ncbi:RLA class II histocompatibility antigen, DP alpha-1 chain-like isoform X1 [Hemicordylus capensis]|uniref:RLA class II histocompatibility antigen, DP alpha-1 chain-like isoform X1 n=2 Tax=Hemicordylus capensis TaxID=884348 RepID=UPI00230249BB|nr:RLA class II histocompatibility antigen, DP alpha-1 chain-like isoform X1 [Hemicordylus capensis]
MAGDGALFHLCLWALLALPGTRAVKVDTSVELDYFQESFPSEKMSGEFLQELNDEEVFHVDWDKRETVWRLPEYKTFTGFDAQGAVGNMNIMKNNMEVLMQWSNRTRAQNAPPTATVFPQNPVELGDPNVLICFVDKFSPPVLNITWLKNGEEVSKGVTETDFYPSTEATFRKFSYLTFIPQHGDFYVCKVDHWGLTQSLTKLWDAKEPAFIPETAENVLCGLGLAFGILGIIAGTVLFFKARKMNGGNHPRGPL